MQPSHYLSPYVESNIRAMLGMGPDDSIPRSLLARIFRIDELCYRCGGSIRSRQILALIVYAWLASQRKKRST